LTVEQAQRLCGVERATCQAVLEALVDAKVLCRNANGIYALHTGGDVARWRAANGDVRMDEAS
jgi:hypothetical protein